MSSILMRIAERDAVQDAVQDAALGNPAFTELVGRFLAGESPDQAVACTKRLNGFGLLGIVAPVGVLAPDVVQIAANVRRFLRLIELLAPTADLNEISVLPTLLGLADGIAAARPQVAKVVRVATEAGVKVTLDMGSTGQTDATLQLFRELHANVPDLGIAVQTRLRRTPDDVRALAPLGARVRVCAGVFPVPPGEGVSPRQDADLAYVRCLRTLMESPSYPMVATHDHRLIPIAEELAERSGRTTDEYEYQLLHGVRPIEQRRLADTGHRSRVYLPFGADWYDYIALRIASRPFTWARSLWMRR